MANAIALWEVICDNNNNNDDNNDKNDTDDDDHGDNGNNKNNIYNHNNYKNKDDCLSQCIQLTAFSVLCSNFAYEWLQQILHTFCCIAFCWVGITVLGMVEVAMKL